MRGVETRLSMLGSGLEVRRWRWKLYTTSLAREGGYSYGVVKGGRDGFQENIF